MKRPSFLQGVAVALVLACAAAAAEAALSLFVPEAYALRMTFAGVAGAYVFYLLSQTEVRTGRLAVGAGWIAGAFAVAFVTPLALFVIAHAVMAWLVRAVYFHDGALSALADLALAAAALAAAVWAATTGSLFLTVWTCFLVSALFVVLPATGSAAPQAGTTANAFLVARRSADIALRRMASRR